MLNNATFIFSFVRKSISKLFWTTCLLFLWVMKGEAGGAGKQVVSLHFSESAPNEVTVFAAMQQNGEIYCNSLQKDFPGISQNRTISFSTDSPWIRAVVIQPGCRSVEFTTEIGTEGSMDPVPDIPCASLPKLPLHLQFVDSKGNSLAREKFNLRLDYTRILGDRYKCMSSRVLHPTLASGITDENGQAKIELPDYKLDGLLHESRIIIDSSSADDESLETQYNHEGYELPVDAKIPLIVKVVRMGTIEWKLGNNWEKKTKFWRQVCQRHDCVLILEYMPQNPLPPGKNRTNFIIYDPSGKVHAVPGKYGLYIAKKKLKRFSYYDERHKLFIEDVSLSEAGRILITAENGNIEAISRLKK